MFNIGGNMGVSQVSHESLALRFEPMPSGQLAAQLEALRQREPAELRPVLDQRAIDGLKFSACLTEAMAIHALGERFRTQDGMAAVANQPILWVG